MMNNPFPPNTLAHDRYNLRVALRHFLHTVFDRPLSFFRTNRKHQSYENIKVVWGRNDSGNITQKGTRVFTAQGEEIRNIGLIEDVSNEDFSIVRIELLADLE